MHRNGLEHDRRHRLLRPLRAASAGSIGRGYGGGVTAQRTIAARRWLVGWVAGEGSRASSHWRHGCGCGVRRARPVPHGDGGGVGAPRCGGNDGHGPSLPVGGCAPAPPHREEVWMML